MIQKIISSGQSGVGRGALNAAIALDIPYAGWTPTGRFLNGEPLPESYPSEEMIKGDKSAYIVQNVNASDGTLIVTNGQVAGESAMARKTTMTSNKPWLLIDLGKSGSFHASQTVHEWLGTHDIKTLYVVGATAGESRKIQKMTQNILEATYYLGLIENNMIVPATLQQHQDMMNVPTSIENAVSQTITTMPLKDRVTMANLSESELNSLHSTLGAYIRRELSVWQENPAFILSLKEIEKASLGEDALVSFIIRKMWEALRETHKIRIVK